MTKKSIISLAVVGVAMGVASIGVYAAPILKSASSFDSAAITAEQAINTALNQIPGQAVKVDFEHKMGKAYYEVDINHGNQKHEVKVDAASGKVIKSDVENLKNPVTASVSLQQAIAKAQATVGGKVKEAKLKTKEGQIYYKIETVNQQAKHELKIDANNGSILANEQDTKD